MVVSGRVDGAAPRGTPREPSTRTPRCSYITHRRAATRRGRTLSSSWKAALRRSLGLVSLGLWLVHAGLVLVAFYPPVWSIEWGVLDRLDWRTPVAGVAVSLLVVLVVSTARVEPRMVDRFLGAFLLITVLLEAAMFVSLETSSSFYTGSKLIVILTRFFCYAILSVATVYGLFLDRDWVRWAALAAIVVWLVAVSWPIEPNSPEYFRLVEGLTSTPPEPIPPDVSVTILNYPEPAHYVMYLGVLVWTFTRSRFGGRA